MTKVRQIAVPPAARAPSTLSRIDSAMRTMLSSGWASLGLKHGQAGGDRSVLGWEIRRSTEDVVLLGADSHIGMPAELLVERRRDGLLFATFVEHGNPVARTVWAGVEPVHVPIVRRLLERVAT
jgi:hypothetical protein